MSAPSAPDEMRASTSQETDPAVPRAGRRLGKIVPLLLLGYFALSWLGYVWIRHPGVMAEGQDFSYDRAMFQSVNSVTLSGFQQGVGLSELNSHSHLGPMLILGLTLGGSLLTLVIGGLAAVRVLRLPYRDGQVITAALTAELLAILAGSAGLIGSDRSLVDAVQMAAAAFGNCGAVVGKLPGLFDWRTHLLLLPIALLGGLGLPVLMELYDALFGVRKPSRHTRTALAWTTGMYFCGFALLLALQWPTPSDDSDAPPQPTGWPAVRQAVASSSVLALDSRTAGFSYDLVNRATRPAQWIVMLLMVIGASPAGTAGGLKTTTVHTLFGGVRDALRGRAARRAFGIAGVWLGIYSLIVLIGFLLLLNYQPQMQADRVLFVTISAVSNVGLSYDLISIVGPGLYVLCALMLAGRIAPLLILWWLATTTADAEVLVG